MLVTRLHLGGPCPGLYSGVLLVVTAVPEDEILDNPKELDEPVELVDWVERFRVSIGLLYSKDFRSSPLE